METYIFIEFQHGLLYILLFKASKPNSGATHKGANMKYDTTVYRWLVILTGVVIYLTLHGCTLKHETYTKKDIWANVAFHTLNVMDYAGTAKSLDDFPGEIVETNRWLGPNPSHKQLIAMALTTSTIYELVTYYTPAKYRWWVQAPAISLKGTTVIKNADVYWGVYKHNKGE